MLVSWQTSHTLTPEVWTFLNCKRNCGADVNDPASMEWQNIIRVATFCCHWFSRLYFFSSLLSALLEFLCFTKAERWGTAQLLPINNILSKSRFIWLLVLIVKVKFNTEDATHWDESSLKQIVNRWILFRSSHEACAREGYRLNRTHASRNLKKGPLRRWWAAKQSLIPPNHLKTTYHFDTDMVRYR